MPKYTVEKLKYALRKFKKKSFNVTLLGLSYKGNVGDLRESPALEILKLIKKEKNIKVGVYDPFVPNKSNFFNLEEAVSKADAVIICTNHNEFKNANPSGLFRKTSVKLVLDGRNIWNKGLFKDSKITYMGIGQ
jgi:UDP-N-acetyl-D-mannosaminuronic acid dehydrogenase